MLLPLNQAPLKRFMKMDKSDFYIIHMLQYKIMANTTQVLGGGGMHTID
jgi:hypothetical protein